MKPRSIFDVDAWVKRTFAAPPKPATPRVSFVKPTPPEAQEDKVPEKQGTLTPEDKVPHERGCSPAVREIIKIVSDVSGLSVQAICGQSRIGQKVSARQIAIWLARNFTDRSLKAIGSEFSGRDHTTVLHAVNRIEKDVREGLIEPGDHTVEAWAKVLITHHRDRDLKRLQEYEARQKVLRPAKYDRARAAKKAKRVAPT